MKKCIYLIAFSFFSGCVTQKPIFVSPMSMGGNEEQVVGLVEGYSSAVFVPFISTYAALGEDDGTLKTAIENALSKVDAHSLINVTVDRRCSFFPFPVFYVYARCGVHVTGTAVRYIGVKGDNYLSALKHSRQDTGSGNLNKDTAEIPKENESRHHFASDAERFYSQLYYEYEKSIKKAMKFMKTLLPSEHRDLERYVIAEKGRLSDKRFKIRKELPSEEKLFVMWFVSDWTQYRPIIR